MRGLRLPIGRPALRVPSSVFSPRGPVSSVRKHGWLSSPVAGSSEQSAVQWFTLWRQERLDMYVGREAV